MTDRSLLEGAAELLAANTRVAHWNERRITFSVPSAQRYPFQWFWDSCFHAIVWAQIDAKRAIEELRGLFTAQASSGFIPHVIFWDEKLVRRLSWHYLESRGPSDWFIPGRTPHASALIQPPVLAQAVEAVVAAGEPEFLDEALPVLGRYYRYLARCRDPENEGLLSIVSRFESGLDFSPAYDRPGSTSKSAIQIGLSTFLPQVVDKLLNYDDARILRLSRHQFKDVLVNSLYADGLRALARLASLREAADLKAWADEHAGRVLERLVEQCYDRETGLFFNLRGPRRRPGGRVKTVVSLMPLLLPELPDEIVARLLEHLTDPREFWASFPVPSVALDEPSFTPDSMMGRHRLIWRGPTSMNTNWFLTLGLRRHGQHQLADELARSSRNLVRQAGFNEFFNPLDGSPVGAPRFGWATLAALF